MHAGKETQLQIFRLTLVTIASGISLESRQAFALRPMTGGNASGILCTGVVKYAWVPALPVWVASLTVKAFKVAVAANWLGWY